MTGLDIENDRLLEVACLVTDKDLKVIAKGPDLVVYQPDELLAGMGDWCKEHHGQSGLTDASRGSRITESDVDDALIRFVEKYTPAHQCPLAGSSIHQDLRFLRKWCPRFVDHLHYRIIDVSTVSQLCSRWYNEKFPQPESDAKHRAMADINLSIEKLEYFRQTCFKVK